MKKDNKPKSRKHYYIDSEPVKKKVSMQDNLDRLGYPDKLPVIGSDDYVKFLGI